MDIWCGDEAMAHKLALLDLKGPDDRSKFTLEANASAFKDYDNGYMVLPAMAQMAGETAIVRVNGGLVSGSAGWKRFFGITGYEDIKAALLESMGRQDVKSILLHVNSPGGSVNGMQATADLIREISKVKPMATVAATACSAGYWLGASTGYVVAEEMALIGSIGCVMQLATYTKAQENAGVQFHTFKSGALKMAGNPNEEMSDEARKNFQEIVDDMCAVFMHNVAAYRKMDTAKLKAKFGDGRAVLAQRAMAGGLVDKIGGLQQGLKYLASAKAKK